MLVTGDNVKYLGMEWNEIFGNENSEIFDTVLGKRWAGLWRSGVGSEAGTWSSRSDDRTKPDPCFQPFHQKGFGGKSCKDLSLAE